jgi:hypothetical protein
MDKRTAFRFPTELEADCRSSDTSWKSRLRNISTGGCMIECPDAELAKGAPLRLRLKGLPAIDGEIAWQHRGHAGIKFRQDLRPALLEDLAFRTPGYAFDPAPACPPPASRSAAPALHAQLVKRTNPLTEAPAERLARAG